MTVMTSAGSTLAVSAALPATEDAAGYNALTWTVAGEVTDLGEVGKEFNTVNHSPLQSRRVIKIKGSYNNGTMAVQMGRDFTDAGQAALVTALSVDVPYAVRLTLQNGKKLYFKAMVSSFKYNIGGVDSITAASCNFELVSDIVEV